MIDEIAAFYVARLDEDETLIALNMDGRGLCDGFPDYRTYSDVNTEAADDYIERFGPARALREVAVKRERLTAYLAILGGAEAKDPRWQAGGLFALEFCVREDISVWSDHPDYKPQWALDR